MQMKKEILSMLGASDDYVSGQALSEKLQVSRTAVWKVINQLKEEGYEIESVQNRGYRILSRPDVITAEEIESRSTLAWAASEVVFYEVIDSTNNEAKRLAEKGAAHGTLVVAEEQQAGKGRRGKSWMTPAGTAIAMSLILRPDLPPGSASMLTLVMGLSVASACRDLYGVKVQIKWPNDVVSDGKKVCGILTEMSCETDYINYVVIGTGINTGIEKFPPELSDIAASLHTLAGRKIDRSELILACLGKFEDYYARFCAAGDFSPLRDEYLSFLAGMGEKVRVLSPGNEFEGISEGINAAGELLVRRDDGTLDPVNAGEVSVRGIYGYAK